MPRIRQYADRDAMRDFMGELKAQCARLDYDTQEKTARLLGVSQPTAGRYLKDPENGGMTFKAFRILVKTVKPDPEITLRMLGYGTNDLKKMSKNFT